MNPAAPPLRDIAGIEKLLEAHAESLGLPDGWIGALGVADLLGLVVRPTPAFRHKMDVYRERVLSKDWPARWPGLTILMTWDEAYPASYSSFDRIDT